MQELWCVHAKEHPSDLADPLQPKPYVVSVGLDHREETMTRDEILGFMDLFIQCFDPQEKVSNIRNGLFGHPRSLF